MGSINTDLFTATTNPIVNPTTIRSQSMAFVLVLSSLSSSALTGDSSFPSIVIVSAIDHCLVIVVPLSNT